MSLNMPVERTDDTDRRMTSKEREAPMTSNAIGRERLPKISSILPMTSGTGISAAEKNIPAIDASITGFPNIFCTKSSLLSLKGTSLPYITRATTASKFWRIIIKPPIIPALTTPSCPR